MGAGNYDFPDVEINSGPRAVPQCWRVMFSNINGLHGNRDEIAIAATKFNVVLSPVPRQGNWS